MRNLNHVFVLVLFMTLVGCAMWRAQSSINPPGGCDQCHVTPISANWQFVVTAATLTDDTEKPPWQKEESVLATKPVSSTQKEIRGQRCFACHTGADAAHSKYRGEYSGGDYHH